LKEAKEHHNDAKAAVKVAIEKIKEGESLKE
jgi:hypothetical protein